MDTQQLKFDFMIAENSASTTRAAEFSVWIIVGASDDLASIRKERTGSATRLSAFVRIADGGSPFERGSITLLVSPERIYQLFRSTDHSVPAAEDILPRTANFIGPVGPMEELLFLNLSPSGRAVQEPVLLYGDLPYALSRLQNTSNQPNAYLFERLTRAVLDALPTGSSPVLNAICKRMRADALMQILTYDSNAYDNSFDEVAHLYRAAEQEFNAVALPRQAQKCRRLLLQVMDLDLSHRESRQLTLPGIIDQHRVPLDTSWMGFRVRRCLGLRIGENGRLAQSDDSERKGSISVFDRAVELTPKPSLFAPLLMAIDGGGYQVQAKFSCWDPRAQRGTISVVVDWEHLVMAGIAGAANPQAMTTACDDSCQYSVTLTFHAPGMLIDRPIVRTRLGKVETVTISAVMRVTRSLLIRVTDWMGHDKAVEVSIPKAGIRNTLDKVSETRARA